MVIKNHFPVFIWHSINKSSTNILRNLSAILKSFCFPCEKCYIAHIKIPIEKMQKTQQIGAFSVAFQAFCNISDWAIKLKTGGRGSFNSYVDSKR